MSGCSLTESLDENHASYLHFGGSEFYLEAAEQNTSLYDWSEEGSARKAGASAVENRKSVHLIFLIFNTLDILTVT